MSVADRISYARTFPTTGTTGHSFFLCCLCTILHTTGRIGRFHFHASGGKRIICRSRISVVSPVTMPNGAFCAIHVPCRTSFRQFCTRTCRVIRGVPRRNSPCKTRGIVGRRKSFSVVRLDTAPRLCFASLACARVTPSRPLSCPLVGTNGMIPHRKELMVPVTFAMGRTFISKTRVKRLFRGVRRVLGRLTRWVRKSRGTWESLSSACMYVSLRVHSRVSVGRWVAEGEERSIGVPVRRGAVGVRGLCPLGRSALVRQRCRFSELPIWLGRFEGSDLQEAKGLGSTGRFIPMSFLFQPCGRGLSCGSQRWRPSFRRYPRGPGNKGPRSCRCC